MSGREVWFISDVPGSAAAPAAAFDTEVKKWGLPCRVVVATPAELSARSANSAQNRVAVVADGKPLPDSAQAAAHKIMMWSDERPNSEQAADLIAVLLGGTAGGSEKKSTHSPIVAAKPPKPKGTVKLSRETAGRRGKGVTVVSELPLTLAAIEELGATLKAKCGTGGTVKDARIEIQGDHRDRVQAELEKLGYKVKRSGG